VNTGKVKIHQEKEGGAGFATYLSHHTLIPLFSSFPFSQLVPFSICISLLFLGARVQERC
jgi:hypothetical protein